MTQHQAKRDAKFPLVEQPLLLTGELVDLLERQRRSDLRRFVVELQTALDLKDPHSGSYEDDLRASVERGLALAAELEAMADA